MPIDYKRYPPNWKSGIVPFILNRAENRCECCGLTNGQNVWAVKFYLRDDGRYKMKSIWFRDVDDAIRECTDGDIRQVRVVLTIAHLDHDETNHSVSMDRLKAMCQLCHLRYDAKEKYRRSIDNWNLKDEPNT